MQVGSLDDAGARKSWVQRVGSAHSAWPGAGRGGGGGQGTQVGVALGMEKHTADTAEVLWRYRGFQLHRGLLRGHVRVLRGQDNGVWRESIEKGCWSHKILW